MGRHEILESSVGSLDDVDFTIVGPIRAVHPDCRMIKTKSRGANLEREETNKQAKSHTPSRACERSRR